MSGDRGVSFPVAAISVVALFLTTTFLGQQAFDLLRLAESDAAKQRQFTKPPVEARLWEDPLAALVRHSAKVREMCPAATAKDTPPNPRCPFDAVDGPALRDDLARSGSGLTVIAALVPGASFLGVEEARRRTRYALLAGLGVEGFVPDDSERMGLLSWSTMNIPYETFSTENEKLERGANEPRERRVVVFWIDDVAFGKQWLSRLTMLLGDVVPQQARLRILGPFTSDALVDALDDDLATAWRNPDTIPAVGDERALKPYLTRLLVLPRLQIISPFSTATGERLVNAMNRATPVARALRDKHFECEKPASVEPQVAQAMTWRASLTALVIPPPPPEPRISDDCVDRVFADRLRSIGAPLQGSHPFFVRTIGTDDLNLRLLLNELCVRGLGDGKGGRIVVLREWDSIYARSLALSLRSDPLPCPVASGETAATMEVYSYLRGLDGANLDGAPKQQRLVPRAAGSKARDEQKEPEIEWPETRDQRDYVRRVVRKVQREAEDGETNGKDRVRAVGVIGTDVHDKLILAQALRAAFPDRVLFTTDLDARLLHPEMLKHTRNLVIASSLPLDQVMPFDQPGGVRVPPFRDVYQTAGFLGVRYAVAADNQRAGRLSDITRRLGRSHLFEVSRDGAIELSTQRIDDDELHRRRLFAAVSLGVVSVLGWLMTFGRPAPAMKAAIADREAWLGSFDLTTAIITGLGAASWGFGLGVSMELAAPGHLGPERVMLVALTTMFLFWAVVYPGPKPGKWLALWRLLGAACVLAAAVAVCDRLTPSDYHPVMREPFAAMNGVSAWPSELLRTLALLLFAWFVDFAWNNSAKCTKELGAKYFGLDAGQPPPFARLPAGRRRPGRWTRFCRDLSVWFWQPHVARPQDPEWSDLDHGPVNDGALDGARLWARYLRQLRSGPRLLRTVLWFFAVFIFVMTTTFVVGGEWPEVPARGIDDRKLFYMTILLSVAGTVALLVLVGDATVLTWRFIAVMKDRRTVYPSETVMHFAAELGPRVPVKAFEPIAARVRDRLRYVPPGSPLPRNSLLDGWIDARLLAEHTAAIGPLIVFPFILLGLLIVSRSPLFDNWAPSGPVMYALVGYLLWSVAMAVMLNFGAERARRKTLESMEKDRIWLEGAGKDYEAMANQFPNLIQQVRDLREGAFAPFFEQPVVRAIMVPLGGAGGIQLLEILAFART